MNDFPIVRSGLGHEVGRIKQTLESAGVAPPTLEFVPGHLAAIDVGVIYIGNFQFAAAGRLQGPDDVKNLGIVQVDSDYREIRFGVNRLFINPHNLPPLELRHTEPLWVGHFLQKDFRAVTLLPVRLDRAANVSLNDIVAQDDADWFTAGKVLDQRQRRGDAPFTFLVGIVQVLQTERFAISEQLQKVSG